MVPMTGRFSESNLDACPAGTIDRSRAETPGFIRVSTPA